MKHRKRPLGNQLLKLNSDDTEINTRLNISQRQGIIKGALIHQAGAIGDNAPVAMVAVMVMPDGRTTTIMLNIEPEHLGPLSDAASRARAKMSDFFSQADSQKAPVIPISKARPAKN